MGRVMPDAEFPADHHRHAGGRPHRADKPVRFRSFGEQRREGGLLRCRQFPRLPAAGLAPQPLLTALPRPLQPLAHGAAAHAERLGDAAPRPALLVQVERAEAPSLLPVAW